MNNKIWRLVVTDRTTEKKFVVQIEEYIPSWRKILNKIGIPVELKQKQIYKLLPYGSSSSQSS